MHGNAAPGADGMRRSVLKAGHTYLPGQSLPVALVPNLLHRRVAPNRIQLYVKFKSYLSGYIKSYLLIYFHFFPSRFSP